MSKLDAMRAMREARYEQAGRATKPAKSVTATACGHRSMNGRTCTREWGHSARSHRYS